MIYHEGQTISIEYEGPHVEASVLSILIERSTGPLAAATSIEVDDAAIQRTGGRALYQTAKLAPGAYRYWFFAQLDGLTSATAGRFYVKPVPREAAR